MFNGNKCRNLTGRRRLNPKYFARLLCEFAFCYAMATPNIIGALYFYYFEFYVTVVRDPKIYRLFLCLTIKASLQIILMFSELKCSIVT